jgi:type IV secretory pathway ATPase VirB11/archaellum biosynthesis ATPase
MTTTQLTLNDALTAFVKEQEIALPDGSAASFVKQDELAAEVLKHRNQIVPLLKVTRAGATTSLLKKAVENNMKIVIVEPTHKIGKETVKKALELTKNKNAKIL